jgi:outer membrane murein-binding lipoprotein Lpp
MIMQDFEGKLAQEREKEQEDIKSLEDRLNEKIDGGSAAASAEIGEKVQEMGAKVEELGNKVDEVEGKVGGIEGKVAEHTEKITELEQGQVSAEKFDAEMHEVSLLRDRVVAVEEKSAGVDELNDKMTAVEEKVTALEGDYVKSGALENYITNEALEKVLGESSQATDLEIKPLVSKVDDLAKKMTELEGAGVSEEAVAKLECIMTLEQQLARCASATDVSCLLYFVF